MIRKACWVSSLAISLFVHSAAGRVTVTDFGAVADGKSDCASAFKKAFEASKDVYVPAGQYLVAKIDMPENGFLHGAGTGSVIILAKGKGTITVSSGGRISNLSFTGQEKNEGKAETPQEKALLSIRSAKDIVIDQIRIEDYKFTGICTDHADDLRITNSDFVKLNWGILLQYSNRVLVSGNRVIDAVQHGIQFWGQWKFEIKDCADLIFSNNYVKNGGGGAIWGTGGKRVVMANNIVDGATDVGLDLEWCEDSTITGNTVRNCENGGISLFFSCQRISITGNTVINDRTIADPKAVWWVRSGIWLTYPNRETYKNDFGHRDVTIVGNTISCAEGDRRAIWIGSESDNIVIANNTVRGGEVWTGGKHKVHPLQLTKIKSNTWIRGDKAVKKE